MYEVFEHTADVGLRIVAPDLETLLVEAARGLFSIIVANLDQVRPLQLLEIRVSASAADYLLRDWLSELLYICETQRLLLAQFDVRMTDDGLQATAHGEPLDPTRHVLANEVKAITYHGLQVKQTDTGWQAEVIVDI